MVCMEFLTQLYRYRSLCHPAQTSPCWDSFGLELGLLLHRRFLLQLHACRLWALRAAGLDFWEALCGFLFA